MNQLSFVILSTGLESLKELRGALTSNERTRLLAGGDDAEQLHPEIMRLRPNAAIITLGAQPESALKFVERLALRMPADGDHLRFTRCVARSHPALFACRGARLSAPAPDRR
jgi:hypothetical protein